MANDEKRMIGRVGGRLQKRRVGVVKPIPMDILLLCLRHCACKRELRNKNDLCGIWQKSGMGNYDGSF